jgi:hypothetical protein
VRLRLGGANGLTLQQSNTGQNELRDRIFLHERYFEEFLFSLYVRYVDGKKNMRGIVTVSRLIEHSRVSLFTITCNYMY